MFHDLPKCPVRIFPHDPHNIQKSEWGVVNFVNAPTITRRPDSFCFVFSVFVFLMLRLKDYKGLSTYVVFSYQSFF